MNPTKGSRSRKTLQRRKTRRRRNNKQRGGRLPIPRGSVASIMVGDDYPVPTTAYVEDAEAYINSKPV
jgi:hypothetical protein